MECDSDESERWEDFFGSSTDISPSVIAYYDRLRSPTDDTISINSLTHSKSTLLINSTTNDSNSLLGSFDFDRSPRSQCIDVSVEDSVRSPSKVPPLPKVPPPSFRRRFRNFPVLSANVQRLISNTVHLDDMNDNHSADESNSNCVRKCLPSPQSVPTNGSKFKHPLSKNTGKLTQFGSELVIDDSDGGYVTPPEIFYEIKDNLYVSATDSEPQDAIETTVNEFPSFDFDGNHESNNGNYILDEVGNGHKDDGTNDNNNDDRIALKNASFVHSTANKSETISNVSSQSGSVQNSPTLSQKSTDSETKATKTQLFAIKAQVEQSNKSNDSPDNTNAQNETAVAADKKKTGEMKIDLKRTKIRPLSSVSISSTSSSSSSVSDEHSTNQNAISYLASVESLADHSENELAILSPSLTVTERACLEIIDSERSYVNDLGQVIRGYLNDWQQQGHLESNELNTLFGNIEEVYDISVILLSELEQSGTDPIKIAKCFIKLQDEFDAYTQYCTCYPDAISLLTTLLQASHTNALLATTQQSLHHTLPLGSYLLKPVQRILKYHLLLDNLRKHCDVVEALQAHGIMRNVAQHIDQVKRNLEQQSRVRELSGILDGWLGPELTVLGDLVLEGLLTENSKPRTVLLFETMLIITKKKEDNRLQFKTYINCKNLMLIEHLPGEPESFCVIPYNDPHPNQIKLAARNRDLKRKWAQHIKQVMLAHFDIPNRAKELVFKLGEEEERPTDKNTWRWNNSSATPGYLERRNQYRRSETRYRSKKQRKNANTSLSMIEDQLDQSIQNTDCGKNKLDSMIKELQKRNSMAKQNDDTESISSQVTQVSDIDSIELSNIYEIPFDANKALPSKPASALDKAKSKLLEVRNYNTKTLPKRIANLKKQRSKTLKETSKFYMELPKENTDTVLKITEKSDDLSISDMRVNRRRASLDATDNISKFDDRMHLMSSASLNQTIAMSKNKRDIDIISELLKDHKEFDRILKKPPKKSEGDKCCQESRSKFSRGESLFSLPLPPIPVEATDSSKSDAYYLRELPSEPIYESLLRNVHVPYKFPSPVLNRSLSQPSSRFLKVKRPTEAPPKRPDSDYVTLTFNENGELADIDDGIQLPKHGSHFRKSDTNINYHVRKMSDEIVPSIESFSSFGDSLRGSRIDTDVIGANGVQNSDLQENPLPTLMSMFKSADHLNISKSGKLPERRVSDVTGMHRKSIIHKQGSKAVGSRIASVDYADPKILFANSSFMISSKPSIKTVSNLQRDSAFSLTSSNDSVNTPTEEVSHVNVIYSNQMKSEADVSALSVSNASPFHSCSSSGDDSYYEKTVETSLENDSIFRDSAIYSDDNAEKSYIRPEHIYSTIEEVKQEEKLKPTIPPKLHLDKIRRKSIVTRVAPPPPVPVKPAITAPIVPMRSVKRDEQTLEKLLATPLPPPPKEMDLIELGEQTEPIPDNEENQQSNNEECSHFDINEDRQSNNEMKLESLIAKQLKMLEVTEKNSIENDDQAQVTPPPVPMRQFTNKNSYWVMKQIQNFDK